MRLRKSLDLESLLQALGKLREDGFVAYQERDAGGAGSGGEFGRVLSAKGNHGQMPGGGVLPQTGDYAIDIGAGGSEVSEDQEGFAFFGGLDEEGGVVESLDPVVEVLEAVDELAARQ